MIPTPKMIEAAAEMIMAYDSGTPFEWDDAPEHVKLAYKSRAADVLQAALACLWSDDMESAPRDGTQFQGWIAPLGAWEPRCRINDDGVLQIWDRDDYDSVGWCSMAEYPDTYQITHWAPAPSGPPEAP